MKLTDTKIKQAKPKDKEYPLTDGHGLNIIIKPNGLSEITLKAACSLYFI